MQQMTAQEHRKAAKAARQRSADSWERSDTDGFMSQWASDLTARQHELAAKIIENGGKWSFPALSEDGSSTIPARIIKTRFGSRWAIFETAEECNRYNGTIIKWVGLGEKALAKHGLEMVWVERPAKASLEGATITSVSERPVLADGEQKYDPDAPIVG